MINSHADKRLTKEGGMAFDIWGYILTLENAAHNKPLGPTIDPEDWREDYDEDVTPHDALEQCFNDAADSGV